MKSFFRTVRFWVVTTSFVAMFMIALSLGTWQVKRLEWKEELVREWQAASVQPPLLASCETIRRDIGLFRKVMFKGSVVPREPAHLYAPNPKESSKQGFRVIGGVECQGERMIVDFGWREQPISDAAFLAQKGELILTGIMAQGEEKSLWQTESKGRDNIWVRLDLPLLAEVFGATEPNVYIRILEESKDHLRDEFIRPEMTKTPPFYNHHREYTIMWYALAFVSLVIYIRFVTENRKNIDN